MTKQIWAKAKVGTRAGRMEPEDDKDDSEDDHDVYLVSVRMFGGGLPGSVIERVI